MTCKSPWTPRHAYFLKTQCSTFSSTTPPHQMHRQRARRHREGEQLPHLRRIRIELDREIPRDHRHRHLDLGQREVAPGAEARAAAEGKELPRRIVVCRALLAQPAL